MTFGTRTILALTLTFSIAGELSAQATTTATSTQQPATTDATAAPTTATAPTERTENEEGRTPAAIRERFILLLNRHPLEVSRVIALDPTLINNGPFMARYPDLAQYVTENAEIRRNPHYYAPRFEPVSEHRNDPAGEAFESFMILMIVLVNVFALGWFIRTIIEQRRWNRLSRAQSEVHNKIIDRFGTSDELLQYMKTAAGTKFLESAPIPLHTEPVRGNPAITRVMWTIQIGVVLAAAGLGMFIVSIASSSESAGELFAMGVIALCIGAGFIASTVVSIIISRRFGIFQERGASTTNPIDDPGLVR